MTLAPANSTYAYIETKVRRLTASSSEQSLRSASIQEYVNNFYNQNFPNSIKTDQMRSVYTFYTAPNIDRYPVNVNYNQGFRSPVYVDGIQGSFFKDRDQFFLMWPRWPTLFQQSPTTLTGSITAATNANPCQITSANHGLITGSVISITGVVGMIQLNGNTYTITVVDANNFTLNGIDSTAFGVYISDGTWTANNQFFSFTIGSVPFLSQQVTIGSVDTNGGAIRISDDGNGNLLYDVPNPIISVPPALTNVPGMKNLNTGNPGDLVQTLIGTVNYVTGQFTFTLPSGVSVGTGQILRIFVSQYTTGRPYSLLFWNNEITIRPVPKWTHKIEVETYLTPVQFMSYSNNPIMNQWAKYIAYGAAIDILTDRQDMDGVNNLMDAFKYEEGLVLERQGAEEIGQRNTTIFSSSVQGQGNYWGSWGNWY